jgi:hypothetical protein
MKSDDVPTPPVDEIERHLVPPIEPEAAQAVEALPCGERMKAALRLVVAGRTYREAAAEMGYSDHRDVYRWAKRAGLLAAHDRQLVEANRRVSALANAELERRLIDAPESIGTRDLAIIGGIAADKVVKFREREEETRGPDRLAQMLAALQSSDMEAHLAIRPAGHAAASASITEESLDRARFK